MPAHLRQQRICGEQGPGPGSGGSRKKNDWWRRVKNKEEAASPESSAEEASQEQGKEKRQSPGGAETAPPRAESQKGEVEVLGEHHTEGMRLGFWCLRSLVAALVCMWLSRARPGEIQARLLGCLPSSPCIPGSPLSNDVQGWVSAGGRPVCWDSPEDTLSLVL
ncbi:uncharacterized protein AAGF69_008533 [Amazona ochrocephala]